MKTSILYQAIGALGLLSMTAHAQFDCGSNGSYGPLVIGHGENVTLQAPPDGIFHCTTVSIDRNSTLRFTKNAANTPIYILANSDVRIGISAGPSGNPAKIYISGNSSNGLSGGIGGPGGFDGGQGGQNPGDGHGPGGGKGGWTTENIPGKPANMIYRGNAGFATQSTHPPQLEGRGAIYGNSLLIPMIGGSGGGGGITLGGGGGGGALLIASNTKISFGQDTWTVIECHGGYGGSDNFGNGSPGAVRIVAPLIDGHLTIENQGGREFERGNGRVRIDTLNNRLALTALVGPFAVGSNMVVFPTNFPKLRVLQVGDRVISPEDNNSILVILPPGSPQTQTVKVAVSDFKTNVPLQAVVTPEAGPRTVVDFQINNTSGGTTEGTVNVTLPAGVSSRVDVWTR